MARRKSLGGVIQTFGELINRHVEGNHCWLEEGDGGEVWLFNEKSISAEPGRIIADQAGLMSMINLVRLVTGPSWYPDKAVLQTEPTDSHRQVPGICDIDFKFRETASGFAFPAQWLLRSTGPSNIPNHKQDRSLGLLEKDEPVSTKLELLVGEIIGVGGICPTLKLMADLCDTSSRSLHRQLKLEELTYQQILDKVRFDRARLQLKTSDCSIKELACQLGYSGSNNFVRAFKRMSGSTPSRFRQGGLSQVAG